MRFYGIYLIIKSLVFKSWNVPARLWRSTGTVDRTSSRSIGPVVGRPMCTRRAQRPSGLGWSTVRSTDWSHPTLGWGWSTGWSTVSLGPVDRAVNRAENNCFLDLARSIGQSTRGVNGHFFVRWPIDRPVDRRAILPLPAANGQILIGPI